MVKVKICGITNWTDARTSFEAGADFLGFNFYRKSPRYITPAAAARITKRLPRDVRAVGVFVNEKEENILAIAQVAGIHQVQLHGHESPEAVARVRRKFPVIKAVKIEGKFKLSRLASFGKADAYLLDTYHPDLPGGTGTAFDWSQIRRAGSRKRLFLAGGLTPANVAEAIQICRPYAVDVCSGTEARPGKKDARRTVAFLRAVRSSVVAGTKLTRKHRIKPRVRN